MRYLLQLSDDCKLTDEEIKELGFEIVDNLYNKRLVTYKPWYKNLIRVCDIPFWKDVESIEAFNELEQIKEQLEMEVWVGDILIIFVILSKII